MLTDCREALSGLHLQGFGIQCDMFHLGQIRLWLCKVAVFGCNLLRRRLLQRLQVPCIWFCEVS